ncbi:hypothetical protein [Geodermatophilus ruber]|uniref:Uncharacterized protein n=1 Tax=Geodermatophilus ruber TaxID=504800 RepID=A0A1I4JXD7_9ACTN|nr:hypothetical protein [Geodermatophilus ruber]SFL71114.1 hypothetical protein SAMN04488085_1162 [Geodermatophilus ruber]
MTTTRRILVTLGLTLAVILTAGLPAQAAFTAKATLPQTAVSTLTVAPVSNLAVTASCTLVTRTDTTTTVTDAAGTVLSRSTTSSYSYAPTDTVVTEGPLDRGTTSYPNADGTTTTVTKADHRYTTFSVEASWTGSPTRGVIGYEIVAILRGQPNLSFGLQAGTSASVSDIPSSYLSAEPRVTVRTHTSYGWTEQAKPQGPITC